MWDFCISEIVYPILQCRTKVTLFDPLEIQSFSSIHFSDIGFHKIYNILVLTFLFINNSLRGILIPKFFLLWLWQCINAVDDYPESLPNLKSLKLRTKIDVISINVLIKILTCSPNLESLYLIIQEVVFFFFFLESNLFSVSSSWSITVHLSHIT